MKEIILLACELLSAGIPFLLTFIVYAHIQKTRGVGLKTGTTILVVMLALYVTAAFCVTGAGTLYDALRYRLALSSRISEILQEKGFTFSPAQYLSIHRRLFDGIYQHAGKIRNYNITKSEWVLDGDTVSYGGWSELRATLEYDMEQEKAFSYTGLSMDAVIRHLAAFVSRLWQIHVFGEGNTRTTAVFFIQYLRALGFQVNNDIFEKNAWYFRNAMVRANYTNLQKDVHETTEYLELFLRNLLLQENNPLSNRTMHISGEFNKQYIGEEKQYIGDGKQYIEKMIAAGLSKRTAENGAKLYSEFGVSNFFGRSDVVSVLDITNTPASTLLKKLAEAGITEAVSGMGKGKYCFNPAFFRR